MRKIPGAQHGYAFKGGPGRQMGHVKPAAGCPGKTRMYMQIRVKFPTVHIEHLKITPASAKGGLSPRRFQPSENLQKTYYSLKHSRATKKRKHKKEKHKKEKTVDSVVIRY
jgi:hypothetical protein